MPIYEYRCSGCEHQFEVWQKIADPPVKVCPKCHARKVEKLISLSSFQLKGTGWYATDYGHGKSGPPSGKSSSGEVASGSGRSGSGSKASDGDKGSSGEMSGGGEKSSGGDKGGGDAKGGGEKASGEKTSGSKPDSGAKASGSHCVAAAAA